MRRWIGAVVLAAGLAVPIATHGGAAMKLIDPAAPEAAARLSIVNDDVMGGRSTSAVTIEDGAFVFSGIVSLDDGGGFASMRVELDEADLRAYEGVELGVRGDGRTYKLLLRDAVGREDVRYQARFETRAGERETLRLPFSRFEPRRRGRPVPDAPPLDRGRIRQLGVLVSDAQAGAFQVELLEVRAYPASGPE